MGPGISLKKDSNFQRPFFQEFTLDIKEGGDFKLFFKELFLGVG